RRTPCNRLLDLDKLTNRLRGIKQRPKGTYLPFGNPRPAQTSKASKAPNRLTVSFSTAHQTTWAYRGGSWIRQNSPAPQSKEFRADNLLVRSARVTSAGYTDPAGNPVPKTAFAGHGKAQLFYGGKKVSGTWSKKSLSSALRLKTDSGAKIRVPPGRTFI